MAATALILATLTVAAGCGLAIAAGLAGRRRQAGRRILVSVVLTLAYTGVLITASLLSRPRTLAHGQWKCFDDWCVTVASSTVLAGAPADRSVTIQVRSRARRVTQRPDDPRAALLSTGGTTPIQVPGLGQRLEPGQSRTLRFTVALPTTTPAPQLLITEGGLPSHLVIGDENSPWHATSSWPLTPDPS